MDVGFLQSSSKNLPAMQATQFQLLHWKDPLEKEMATHSSSLAWKIPWTEEHCRGPASAGSRGYPRDERRQREKREKTHETRLDRAKSVMEREKEREREWPDEGCKQNLAGSGNALFFTIAFVP